MRGCKKYFYEWYPVDMKQFWCRLGSILILAGLTTGLMMGLDKDNPVPEWYNVIVVLIFWLIIWSMLVIYAPWQWKMYPIWSKIVITVIFFGTTIWLIITRFVLTPTDGMITDTICVGIWTLDHLFWGMMLGLVLPFWWMFIFVTIWEAMGTFATGLETKEVFCNRVFDILAAVIGWFIIVLMFNHEYIPWISARNAFEEKLSDEIDSDKSDKNIIAQSESSDEHSEEHEEQTVLKA